jgi:hypothetical protein
VSNAYGRVRSLRVRRSGIGGSWPGAGGRWLRWPLRVVLWTALLVIAFRGITAIISSSSGTPAGGTGTGTGGEFPVSLAEAYAAEFGRVYLRFSPQSLAEREQALAAFVPASVSAADPSLGWNGVGQINLRSLQAADVKVRDPQHAVVTLLALLSGQAAGWWSPASPPGCRRRRGFPRGQHPAVLTR